MKGKILSTAVAVFRDERVNTLTMFVFFFCVCVCLCVCACMHASMCVCVNRACEGEILVMMSKLRSTDICISLICLHTA